MSIYDDYLERMEVVVGPAQWKKIREKCSTEIANIKRIQKEEKQAKSELSKKEKEHQMANVKKHTLEKLIRLNKKEKMFKRKSVKYNTILHGYQKSRRKVDETKRAVNNAQRDANRAQQELKQAQASFTECLKEKVFKIVSCALRLKQKSMVA